LHSDASHATLLPMDVYKEAEQLAKVPMLAGLKSSKLKLLAFTSELVTLEPGQILFHRGEPSDCTFVIMQGMAEVLTTGQDGKPLIVLSLGMHELIGEMGAITNAPRIASVRAANKLLVLRIERDTFLGLLSENSDVALDVMQQLTNKLAKSHAQAEQLEIALQNAGLPHP